MKKESCLVLFSGGQDSTTCLFWALQKFKAVKALHITYGQRHAGAEAAAAVTIAGIAKVPITKIDLAQLMNSCVAGASGLLDKEIDINLKHTCDPSLPASFVPGRNLLFLTCLSIIAYTEGISDLVTGVCQTDYSGYPDCRDNTIKALQVTLSLGMGRDFIIHTPLMWLTKADTVKIATLLDGCYEALAYSHTCYEGQTPGCGKCPACKLRAKGFKEAGVIDPALSISEKGRR